MIFSPIGRKVLICLSVVFSLILLAACRRPPVPPNIVFVLLDAARADHFSSYGYERNTTTHMVAIARHGAVFLSNFVPETETYLVMPLIFSSRHFSRPIFQMDIWQ